MHVIHRGIVNKNFKENLLISFKKSFNAGFGVETDIHATKDEKFVCFHDFTLKRMFKKKLSIKNLSYSNIETISKLKKKPIPLIEDVLKASKNKYHILIEIKPDFSTKLLKKLIKQTYKYPKCIFISFKHKNIYKMLKINKNLKVGLSFSYNIKIKTIIKKSKNIKVNYLVLDKKFLKNKMIQKLDIKKFYYTIKNKAEFKKYSDKNNLIFENL
tara:strand:- start:69 stop:710 length:642 start_codon:yes stop_codon:yes gene_type:complete